MIVVGVTGYKRCGKDSTANVLVEHGFRKYAFADALRDIAYGTDPMISLEGVSSEIRATLPAFTSMVRYTTIIETIGYERAKEIPDFRRFLQRLGTEGIRLAFGENAWVEALERRLERERPSRAVITDCRFFNEAQWIRSVGVLVRVIRPGFGGDDPHPSEKDIPNLPAHFEITASTLEDLQMRVRDAWMQGALEVSVAKAAA